MPGNVNALEHGGYSARLIGQRARAHKRRILRRLGVRASDLDAVTVERLDVYVRTRAQLDLLPVDHSHYWTATNSTARLLTKLEARLRQVGLDAQLATADPAAALRRHVADRNGTHE